MDQITRHLDPAKFRDPAITAKGETRATVALRALETLWFNTGTLCNLTCRNCYIESSPRNDRLAYLTVAEVATYLDEIARDRLPTKLIGFTGGEPFMNPDIIPMLQAVLSRGFDALVLTNAMKPLRKLRAEMLALRERYGDRLTIRVSIDHHDPAIHEQERGHRSWAPALDGLIWLARNGFRLDVAGRRFTGETEQSIARRVRRAVRRPRHPGGRPRPGPPDAVPGDGTGTRRAGDHHRLLGHPAQIARRRDVRGRRAWW